MAASTSSDIIGHTFDGAGGERRHQTPIATSYADVEARSTVMSSTPALQAVVREIHPELCFATAAGAPMAHAKKTRAGQAKRIRVLEALGFREPATLFGRGLPPGCQLDDLLDACIACWTARCIADGHATTLPAEPPTDARGLRMELWVPTVAPVEVAAAPVEDDALTAAALRLPEEERRVLARRLLASLEEGVGGA
jgi:hypothetical protein